MSNKALLIGINQYQNSLWNLSGCINDVFNIYDLIYNKYAFLPDDIRVLVNERATKENILHRMKYLAENSSSGDIILWYYSGHGSQIRDRNNDELEDHLDEILVPYDHDWDDALKDDDLYNIIKLVHPEAYLYIVLDCCNSGDGARDIKFSDPYDYFSYHKKQQNKEEKSLNRFIRPPADILARMMGRDLSLSKFADYDESGLNYCLFSAAQSFQPAMETFVEGKSQGVFTYHLCKALRKKPIQNLNEINAKVSKDIADDGYAQLPYLGGMEKIIDSQFLRGDFDE